MLTQLKKIVINNMNPPSVA